LDFDLIDDIIVFLDVHNEGCNIGFFDTTIRYNSSRIKEELRLTKDVIEVLDVFLRSLSSNNKGE